jgi:hypothetical protein
MREIAIQGGVFTMSEYQVAFQLFPQNDGFHLAYAPAGTAFIPRVQASDPGPKCVSFKSVEELESKLDQVGLPKAIAKGEVGLHSVTDDQLRSLGFTELPK